MVPAGPIRVRRHRPRAYDRSVPLVTPDTRYADSFRTAMAEESDWLEIFDLSPESIATDEGLRAYVDRLWAERLPETPRPDHFVPSSTFWWVVDDVFCGRISIRHRLNDRLLELGGHIGYWIRPSARGRGHGTAILRAALPEAARLDIPEALVTCDEDNAASRRIIEGAGGRFEDQRGIKRRYWVPTS